MMTLHGYWRSSASYRVRIALALKGVTVNHVAVNLREGAQKSKDHLSINPQGFVPVLELETGELLSQSLAIIEFLDTMYPETALLPTDPLLRSRVKAAALSIAADISPIQNLSVLKYIRSEHGQGDAEVTQWVAHWIRNGFATLEGTAQQYEMPFLMTYVPSLFECCLVPQVYNARRFGIDMNEFPKLMAIDAACRELPAFITAAPENQADAVRALKSM